MSDSEVLRADYVHGYSGRESPRLLDQAATLAELVVRATTAPSSTTAAGAWG